MSKYIINHSHNPDALDDETAPMSTEPQHIYEELEIKEKIYVVFDIIRANEHKIFSRHLIKGSKKRILNIEDVVQMFKELYGFEGPQLSLRKVAKKHSISFTLVDLYKNRILNLLKDEEIMKALRG